MVFCTLCVILSFQENKYKPLLSEHLFYIHKSGLYFKIILKWFLQVV